MKVGKAFGVIPCEGDIGLEIEVEGRDLPMAVNGWRNDNDGSLRGESVEYVLRKPETLEVLRDRLSDLENALVAYGSRFDDSVRAGVHVHINCQELSLVELYNFIVAYLILEPLLVRWCGEYREGNLFCLRASDAEFIIRTLVESAVDGPRGMRPRFHSDIIRYSSMNLKALGDYGSLEFRAMRSTKDFDLIFTWAETLLGIREFSKKFDKPNELIETFSGIGGYEGFIKEALGRNAGTFTDGVKDVESVLMEGVRNAQDVAYATDWGNFSFSTIIIGGLEFPDVYDKEEIIEPLEDY